MHNELDRILQGEVEYPGFGTFPPEELSTIGEVMRGEQHPRPLTEPFNVGEPRLPMNEGAVVFASCGMYYVSAASVEQV